MHFSPTEIEQALAVVRRRVPPTPAYAWPLLANRCGALVIVKHENHTPTGSFKARGGLVFVDHLKASGLPAGLVTATRGNHGQSVAIAATEAAIPALIVVPKGNSSEKNAAMVAFGAKLLVEGADFDEAREAAARHAAAHDYLLVPAFDRAIVKGVSTYAWELFTQWAELDAVFVPLGMGSGICGLIAMRNMLGLKTKIIGVVAEQAPAFARSFQERRVWVGAAASTFADGLACRQPMSEALEVVVGGAADIVAVSEDEIAQAIRTLYEATHNIAEGAGAAAYAALEKTRSHYQGKRVAVVLSGGNIDRSAAAKVLAGLTPEASPRTGGSAPSGAGARGGWSVALSALRAPL